MDNRNIADGDIWRLWRAKLDTCEIAARLQTTEWHVANRLVHIREELRRAAEREGA